VRRYFFISIYLLVLAGCGNALEKKLDALPADAILEIATYDGSGQLVHPDILFHNDTFYLATTPYPFYNDKLENPCFYKSTDGINFTELSPGLNPLVPTPAYDHNDDPDLLFDSVSNEFQIYYLETMRPDSQNVILLTSKTGRTWKKQTALHYNLSQGEIFILSPAVIRGRDNTERMFYVVKGDSTNHIEFIEKKQTWEKTAVQKIQIYYPENFTPWHLDVLKDEQHYYLLCNGFYGNPASFEESKGKYTLLLFQSDDLMEWKFVNTLLDCTDIGNDCHYVYRATGLVSDNTLALWYSYVTSEQTWRIGVKKIPLL